ncbi:protein TIC 22-like, chloroplastic isoform X2 [Vigna angularis]|uniref:protein TIC 22-like, chloroplastic isoform X2 n=1 Tax=Phaseolus angularis TaxID=3914 RepID=UPI0022B5C645|nr:protein TIC 22-like, chloroplastic isoform X2 [Vigna angularis]
MSLGGFQKALADLQAHCSKLLGNLTHLPSNCSSFPALHTSPPWARIAPPGRSRPMSVEAIEERLEGIPVYALSNASEEFLLVSGSSTGKNLGLFCFNKDDAEALLSQVTLIEPHARAGSKVVPIALNKVFQLKVNGVAFRLIPEFSQIQNALKSRSLILKNENKRYRPLFFRKEDLENTLKSAAREQNRLNPTMRQGDIQVATLEDIIKEMRENSTSSWDDVIFIPPGFDVSDDSNEQ